MRRHTDFHKAFDAGRTVEHPTGPLTLEVERLGALQTTSGRIGICEPYSLPGLAPLRIRVPPGIYPVLGGIAMGPDGARTLAACRVLIGSEPPVRWVLAIAEDWQSNDDPDAVPGFDTDCAMLCFADPTVGPVPDFDEVFEILDTDPPPISAPLRGSRDATPWLAVESGRGDGTYAAWWGLDAEGRPVTLELDFQVLWRERKVLARVPIHPLQPGVVPVPAMQDSGGAVEVDMGPWPGHTVHIRVRGRATDPTLLDGEGRPLNVHRAQLNADTQRSWMFTSPFLLPDPVELRLSLGIEREPL